MATLAGWLSWWWLPCELASHFRVQYLWIGLICALGLAAARQWRDAALAAVPVLLNLAAIAPLYWPSSTPRSESASLRVASINVYSGNRRHADVLKFIADTRPDVVLLLEVTTDWRDLLDALAADYPFQKIELQGGNFGMALFSRVPWESATVREFGSAGLPSIVARLQWQGETVILLGTHPVPPGGSEMWRLRNEQFEAMAAFCIAQTEPVVVLGDLNSTSWSAHFGTLLDGTRLRDSRKGFGVQASWPAWSPLPRISIDHCLVSPEITVRKRFIGPDVGSDHYPLVVDLAVDEGAAIDK
jgi:endonuclease/exonuclease/phosphatase (EEP) superfamily protein YafD